MLLLLLLGSIWVAIVGVTYALAVAAANGDATGIVPLPAKPRPELTVCAACHSVIERRRAHEACPACGDGIVAPAALSAFARIPS